MSGAATGITLTGLVAAAGAKYVFGASGKAAIIWGLAGATATYLVLKIQTPPG